MFVQTLDFVMRVFQDACELEGLPSRLLSWNAYADDIADKCIDEITVTAVTAQLKAASAFVSLRLNTAKTESMRCGVTVPVTLDATEAKKERVSVDYDDEDPRDAYGLRAKVAFEGWMTEIQFAADLGVVIPVKTKCMVSIAIKFDDGDSMVAELQGRNGWIRDQDGDAHRMQRLGDERLIHEAGGSARHAGLSSTTSSKWTYPF